MNDVYQFTMSHYSENIKLKQVADIAYMTPQAFCRYFKKRTGKNYIVFLNEIRISEACKKITTGNFDSISSVAYDTGFGSAVSFNRVFKKIVAKSPRQYQKEYLQKIDWFFFCTIYFFDTGITLLSVFILFNLKWVVNLLFRLISVYYW